MLGFKKSKLEEDIEYLDSKHTMIWVDLTSVFKYIWKKMKG